MADRHLRVTQQRSPELGGLIELASGTVPQNDDTVVVTIHMPTERTVEMALGQLERYVKNINENSGWPTQIVWDD